MATGLWEDPPDPKKKILMSRQRRKCNCGGILFEVYRGPSKGVELMALFVRCISCGHELQLHYPAKPAARVKKPAP
jgi:hypothetical protein